MNETEKLLVCAKAVGLNAMLTDIPGRGIAVRYKDPDAEVSWVDYNPLTNDAQAFALLRLLVDELGAMEVGQIIIQPYGKYIDSDSTPVVEGQDLNEAIVNAVVAMEEGK